MHVHRDQTIYFLLNFVYYVVQVKLVVRQNSMQSRQTMLTIELDNLFKQYDPLCVYTETR